MENIINLEKSAKIKKYLSFEERKMIEKMLNAMTGLRIIESFSESWRHGASQ